MKKKLIVLSSFVLSLAPVAALAQQTGTFNSCIGIGLGTIEGIICKIGDILNVVIPVLIVLAVIYFIWGVITYVVGGDEEAKKKGRDKIIFGIIGLAVIVAVWGLVKILTNTFGINTTQGENIVYPTIPY